MSHPEKVRDRVRVIDERLARLRAEKDRLIARATQTERRRETRRKIVIGGTVLAALDREAFQRSAREPSSCAGSSLGSRVRTIGPCSTWRGGSPPDAPGTAKSDVPR